MTEPNAISPTVPRVNAAPEEIAAADAVVLLTDHVAFTSADIGCHAPYLLDCRRVLTGANAETL